jgi:hypothetical protein
MPFDRKYLREYIGIINPPGTDWELTPEELENDEKKAAKLFKITKRDGKRKIL